MTDSTANSNELVLAPSQEVPVNIPGSPPSVRSRFMSFFSGTKHTLQLKAQSTAAMSLVTSSPRTNTDLASSDTASCGGEPRVGVMNEDSGPMVIQGEFVHEDTLGRDWLVILSRPKMRANLYRWLLSFTTSTTEITKDLGLAGQAACGTLDKQEVSCLWAVVQNETPETVMKVLRLSILREGLPFPKFLGEAGFTESYKMALVDKIGELCQDILHTLPNVQAFHLSPAKRKQA